MIPFILHYQQRQHQLAMAHQRRAMQAQMEQMKMQGASLEQVLEAIENDEPLPIPGEGKPTKH